MDKVYHSLEIKSDPTNFEMISAWLSPMAFESFYETEEKLIAYYQKEEIDNKELEELLKSLSLLFEFTAEHKTVENKNWNAEWESSFEPVVIDKQVCIRADFHSAMTDVKHNLVINPKMAFGTAHHETTYMMIQSMLSFDLSGKKVLDYGCGTSILSILAERLGASEIVANDYDINSVENSSENLELNNCQKVKVYHGDLDVIEAKDFDLILANINRNVLLTNSNAIRHKLKPKGILLMSGILESDTSLILEAYKSNFELISEKQKGEWKCFKFEAR